MIRAELKQQTELRPFALPISGSRDSEENIEGLPSFDRFSLFHVYCSGFTWFSSLGFQEARTNTHIRIFLGVPTPGDISRRIFRSTTVCESSISAAFGRLLVVTEVMGGGGEERVVS